MKWVYFIASAGRIKIGVTENLDRRIREIGAHLPEPPELIGAMPGGYRLEKRVHELLSADNIVREWFTDNQDVRSVCLRLISEGPEAFWNDIIDESPAPTSVPTPTREQRLAALNFVLEEMWPDERFERLADFAGASEVDAEAWLNGTKQMPEVVARAVAHMSISWMLSAG